MKKMKEISRKIIATFLIVGTVMSIIVFHSLDKNFFNPKEKGAWVLWNENPASEAIISWESTNLEDSTVYYGENLNLLNYSILNPTLTEIHHIILTDLKSNTKYYYKIGSSEKMKDEINVFQTAPDNENSSFTFMAISDTQQTSWSNGFCDKVAGKLKTNIFEYDFLMNVGDFVWNGEDQSDWDDFFNTYKEVFNKTVLVPVIGNHDSSYPKVNESSTQSKFPSYFPLSSNSNFYAYSFNYSMVHFTICDFQYGSEDEFENLRQSQLEWLKNDLEQAQNSKYRIVSFHCPIEASGFHGINEDMVENLLPILKTYNVSLILNGHDHHYEHVICDGIDSIILGGGGSFQDPHAILINDCQNMVFGLTYTSISVNNDYIQVNTFTLDDDLVDSFKIQSRRDD
ncbi:metallophosphoesterase [Promethearchaeum syntrophicum]|uniref:Metallophosphoesterase n=1 Tax=Promethearchaeum syntrophicum TaxID=2594042 RepID=A0A5B9D5K9_9ARCH|nr:metallophosphoesterase family protein [Candidatus Prometheoarchaeum syntrophicum]QEE14276.1 Calcineurin-like phosphoesterase [Candidatus Prometheoarchaeum syntrophicum]